MHLNKNKGLILGIGLAILVIAGAVAAVLLLGGKESPKLAWNPDMDAMQDGIETRVPDESGYFSVRLWVAGSKYPMVSSSSPKNSALTGLS